MAILSPNDMLLAEAAYKLKNRFIFYIEGIPTAMIKATTLPSFTTGEIQVNHMNTYKMYAGGRRKWNNIEVTLYDPIAPNGQQILQSWYNLQAEDVSGRHGYPDFYKKDCTMNIISPVGEIVSEWVIKGAFIAEYNPGEMDYDMAEEVLTTKITLVYDQAILNF